MEKVARELVKIAKQLAGADTSPCPDCGTKVLDSTKYCVKCKKKIAKELEGKQVKSAMEATEVAYMFALYVIGGEEERQTAISQLKSMAKKEFVINWDKQEVDFTSEMNKLTNALKREIKKYRS